MISFDSFRNLIEESILFPCNIEPQKFMPHFSTKIENFVSNFNLYYPINGPIKGVTPIGRCIFWHEEPLNQTDLENLEYVSLLQKPCNMYLSDFGTYPFNFNSIAITHPDVDVTIQLLANSEKSSLKKQWCKKNNFLDWYFFFHGFAALDWFRDHQYIKNSIHKIDKVFICLNHVMNEKRNYRLYFLSKIYEEKIQNYGHISAPNLNKEFVKKEIFKKSNLSCDAKKHIYKHLYESATPLILDDVNYTTSSASISRFFFNSLWAVVTETVFYDEKLHLTEKIFKPIAAKRPFILAGALGNLAYLKSYGFKTFDSWINESYDNEPDHIKRINLIIAELKKLCALSTHELDTMHQELIPILEYNHHHFYNNFKELIVNEMIENFYICIKQYNLGRFTDRYMFPENELQIPAILESAKKLFML